MLPFSAAPITIPGSTPPGPTRPAPTTVTGIPHPDPKSLATTVPLSAADPVDDRTAATRADDLARAFAADLAPLKDIIAASTSPEDCIRRVEDWVSRHNPANAADVIEKALYVYSMAGARSARPASERRASARPLSAGSVRGDSSPLRRGQEMPK